MLKFNDILKTNKAILLLGTALVMTGCGTPSDMGAGNDSAASNMSATAAPLESHNGTEYTSNDLNAKRLMRIAKKAWQKGNAGTAMRLYAMAGQKDPNNPDPALAMAKILRKTQKLDQALDLYKRISKRFPEIAEPHAGIGYVLLGQDKPYLAAKAFELAVEMDPDNAKSLGGLALSLDTAGEHEKAQGYYRLAIEKAPNNLTYQNNLALSLALSGRTDQAIAMLKVITGHPNSTAQHRQNLALVYGMAGKSVEAMKYSRMDLSEPAARNNALYFEALNGTKGMDQNDQSYTMAAKKQEERQVSKAPAQATEPETALNIGGTYQKISTTAKTSAHKSNGEHHVDRHRTQMAIARADAATSSSQMAEPVVAAAPTNSVNSDVMLPPVAAAPMEKAHGTKPVAKITTPVAHKASVADPAVDQESYVTASAKPAEKSAPEAKSVAMAKVEPVVKIEHSPKAAPTAKVEPVSYKMPDAPVFTPKAVNPKVAALSTDQLYFVQLASFKTEERAHYAWDQMSKTHTNLLTSYEPIFTETDLGGEKGVFYRVRIGSFDNKQLAGALCENLKVVGQDCYLAIVKLEDDAPVVAETPMEEHAAAQKFSPKHVAEAAIANKDEPLYPAKKYRTTASIGY